MRAVGEDVWRVLHPPSSRVRVFSDALDSAYLDGWP